MTTTYLKLVKALLIALLIPFWVVGITLDSSTSVRAAVQEEDDERDREEFEEEEAA